jgi:hypothetical protein
MAHPALRSVADAPGTLMGPGGFCVDSGAFPTWMLRISRLPHP